MKDPYKLLGVAKTATKEEIKQAYRRLAMKHHPDRNDGKDEKFKEIQEAYEKVKDGKPQDDWADIFGGFNKRQGPSTSDFGGFGGFDFKSKSDIEDFLRNHKYNEKKKMKVTASITLPMAVLGGEQLMSIPINGRAQTVKLQIPKGIKDGEAVKYPELITDTDVVITFHILPDKVWEIEDNVLIKHQSISVFDLILGSALDVKTIDDAVIRLKIPAGTNPGTHMRVKGRGINGGDMLVCLDGKIPKDIPSSVLKVLNAIRETKA